MQETNLKIGNTEVYVPPMGTGTMSWGSSFIWGYGQNYGLQDVRAAFEASLAAGINFFDTAEMYGNGRSERILGELVQESEQPIVVATKFFPYPWRLWETTLLDALRSSLQRLGMQQVDLYQVHWPIPLVSLNVWANALAEAVQEGLTRAVGVSNYSQKQMRRTHAWLADKGVPLASNQVEYSLINRKVEKNGLLAACHELNITLIAYSPLRRGLLTGKYTPENPPSGVRGWLYNRRYLESLQPLIRIMQEIGEIYGGKSPAQVALNWVICKGAVPIPGAKNARQAQDNAGALGWRLSEEDVARLDAASDSVK